MSNTKTLRDEDTSMDIALKFAEKFQAHYPKKPIIPMMVELAKDIDNLVASRISELEAENKRLREEHRWIPVTERLPEEEGQYLTRRRNGISFTEHWFPATSKDLWLRCYSVTHWMPLPPQPPKEQ